MLNVYYMKNSHKSIIGNPEFGVFLFGAFYLMYRGLWAHAFVMILLTLPTLGLVWFWYIFKARQYITYRYWREGVFSE